MIKYLVLPCLFFFWLLLMLTSNAVLVFSERDKVQQTLTCTYFTGKSIRQLSYVAATGKTKCNFNVKMAK